ncbi:MAG: DNA-processing protein DprA, partial [bacterium]|nr:DNA-processing protein DprA [bacterium]
MTEKDAVIAFSTFVPIGPARFGLLVKYFGSAKEAWEAPYSEYLKIGLGAKLSEKFEKHRRSLSTSLKGYKEKLQSLGIRAITLQDEEYPARLKEISDPPFLLYVRGSKDANLAHLSEISISVIGTRKMTAYGKDVTERFATRLASRGVTIVSGLALGIDGVSHEAALSVGGATIAVLGNGLDQIYPPANRRLARDIIYSTKGLLVSEYPLGYPAMPHNFPQRNRIVSGISSGVLVIEGTKRSGTLITAASAAKQGREVYAVPGPVTSPVSQAPHLLIREGAKLV